MAVVEMSEAQRWIQNNPHLASEVWTYVLQREGFSREYDEETGYCLCSCCSHGI